MIVFNIYDADSSVCFGVGSFVAKMKHNVSGWKPHKTALFYFSLQKESK